MLFLEASHCSSWLMGDKLRVASHLIATQNINLFLWVFSPPLPKEHKVIRQNYSSETFMIIGFAPNKLLRCWYQWPTTAFSFPIFLILFLLLEGQGHFSTITFHIHFKKPWFSMSKISLFLLLELAFADSGTNWGLVVALVYRSLPSRLC